MTARMDQMRTVTSLCINPVVRESWIAASKAGQQDMGKSEYYKANLFAIKEYTVEAECRWTKPGKLFPLASKVYAQLS